MSDPTLLGSRVLYVLPNGATRPADVIFVAPDTGLLTLVVYKLSRSDFSLPPQGIAPAIILGKDADSPVTTVESVPGGTKPGQWHALPAPTPAVAANPAADAPPVAH